MQRLGADSCPGVFRPFTADDGAIIRLRLAGSPAPVSLLAELVAIAGEFAAPMVQLTSRGNLQLRGLPDPVPEAVVERLTAAGLLPSPTHERVRNIIVAPGRERLRSFVRALDDAICADPALAALPGRFLWAVSDESAAVLGEPWDLALQVLDDRARVLAGGHMLEVPAAEAIDALIGRAHAFLADRRADSMWNVRDLPADATLFAGMQDFTVVAPAPPAPGRHGGLLVAAVPLGFLDAGHVAAIAAVAAEVDVTPWRSVAMPADDRAEQVLAAAGLVVHPSSTWARLSACVGAPFCRRTTSPTMPLTHAAASLLAAGGPRVHVSGCERRCGQPAGDHVSVVAPDDLDALMAAVARG